MLDTAIAKRAGLTPSDLDALLAGKVCATVQAQLSVDQGHIEDYINRGRCAALLADRLGFDMTAAEQLGEALGLEGRVGLILGILISV